MGLLRANTLHNIKTQLKSDQPYRINRFIITFKKKWPRWISLKSINGFCGQHTFFVPTSFQPSDYADPSPTYWHFPPNWSNKVQANIIIQTNTVNNRASPMGNISTPTLLGRVNIDLSKFSQDIRMIAKIEL